MSNILTNLLKKKHHHPDCYASYRLIFLPCVCFASICASTAAKSHILNHMWTAANFIIEGRRLSTVGLGPHDPRGPTASTGGSKPGVDSI